MAKIPAKKSTATKPKRSQTASAISEPLSRNPELPSAVVDFRTTNTRRPAPRLTTDEWTEARYGADIKDKNQQIMLRPWFAGGVFLLIIVQNIGVWFIVVWALRTRELADLQFIFGALVAGTLTQSYFILRFITEKVFTKIEYDNDITKT